MQQNERRNFLKQASYMTAIPAIFPFIQQFSFKKQPPLPAEGKIILFQGDSITDAGRNRGAYYANNMQGLGSGYVFLAAAQLLANEPDQQYWIYNRGISGNKVYQLADRWQDDCLNLQPDVLSILIGVNDYWHKLRHGYKGTVEIYEKDFKALLERTKKAFPDVQLIIGEPFAVKGGSAIDQDWMDGNFDAYRAVANSVAQAFDAAFIPYHSIFEKALESRSCRLLVSGWCTSLPRWGAVDGFPLDESL